MITKRYAYLDMENYKVLNTAIGKNDTKPPAMDGIECVECESWMNPGVKFGYRNINGEMVISPLAEYEYLDDAGNILIDTEKYNTSLDRLLSVLRQKFNAETEQLIITNIIDYENENGSISITPDLITQQNFSALFMTMDFQAYPYTIWEGDKSLELSKDEVQSLCLMIMQSVETIRRERKAIRGTFQGMTMDELTEQLNNQRG